MKEPISDQDLDDCIVYGKKYVDTYNSTKEEFDIISALEELKQLRPLVRAFTGWYAADNKATAEVSLEQISKLVEKMDKKLREELDI